MLQRLKFDLVDLSNEMLDQLPEHIFKSKTTTFYDPSIGGGQFVVEVENRLRQYGHSDENISKRVFGYVGNRIRLNYIMNTHKLVGNYKTTPIENMEFNVVLGNPPYNDTKASSISRNSKSLYIPFVEKAMKLSTEYVILVIPHTWMITKKQEAKDLRENMINFGISSITHTEPGIFGKDNNVNAVVVKLEKGKKDNFTYSRPYMEGKEVITSKPHNIKPILDQGFFPLIFDKLSETLAPNMRLNNNNLKPQLGSVKLPRGYKGDTQGKDVYLNKKYGTVLINKTLYKTSKHVNNFRVAYAYLTGMQSPLLKTQLIRDVKVVPPGVEISSNNKYISCKTEEEANNLYEYLTSKEVNTMLNCLDRGSSLENWMINSLPTPPTK